MRRLLPGLLLGAVAVGLAGLLPARAQAQWGRSIYGPSGSYYGRGFGSYYTYPYSSGYNITPRYSYYFNPGHSYYSPGFSAFAPGASGLYTGPIYYTGNYSSVPGYGFPFRTYPLYGYRGYSNYYYAPGTFFVYP